MVGVQYDSFCSIHLCACSMHALSALRESHQIGFCAHREPAALIIDQDI
ncbi:hypothetical protein M7I_5211 [Glarea lozoyensis 74030]|uniref:Uncharacterized protein n=1 Tax=Glarea lozoyensis (strain ATCC 74030 / MF5533) TaxID=1104152 RepID=H0ER93_GLAL7|nr:hypothetical protein M7I_5211 [Glarea lozoyensis 74030]